MKTQDQLKQEAAAAALAYLPKNAILGIGTGSTVNCLIDQLAAVQPEACVASSQATADRLRANNIPVIALNEVSSIPVYIDGADQIDSRLHMIKGGGGALTGEKIVAAVAKQFICITDDSKVVDILGKDGPIAIEVIPMARSSVARQLVALGGQPVYRTGYLTDYGNVILDTYGLTLLNARDIERTLNAIAGIVTNGIFAERAADLALIASQSGVEARRPA